MEVVFKFFCDNTIAIYLIKNHIQHSRTKHIEIKYHFIIDYVQKDVIDIQLININHQLADIFTKPLTIERFDFIKKNMHMDFVKATMVRISEQASDK